MVSPVPLMLPPVTLVSVVLMLLPVVPLTPSVLLVSADGGGR